VSRIRWSHSARRDYRDVVEWLNDRNPAAASRIADAIENRLAMLAMMLRIGRVGRLEDTRELVIPRTPYLIIYQLERRRSNRCASSASWGAKMAAEATVG
jgi:toxin ParE1/3/4